MYIYNCFVKQEDGREKGRRSESPKTKGKEFGENFVENVRNFFRDCGKAKRGKDKRKIRAKEKKTTERKNKRIKRSVNIIMIANDDDNYSRLPRRCRKKNSNRRILASIDVGRCIISNRQLIIIITSRENRRAVDNNCIVIVIFYK